MKKAVLVLAMAFITLATLATPVLAIGPENAMGKNPMVSTFGAAYDIIIEIKDAPHGIVIEWIQEVPINPELSAIIHSRDARVFQINNAFVVTNPVQVLQIENKWLYLSPSMMSAFYSLVGVPPAMINYIIANHPEGVYFKRNLIGQ